MVSRFLDHRLAGFFPQDCLGFRVRRDAEPIPSRPRTFSPQLGVTSAQLRGYEKQYGVIDTPFTRELRTADELHALDLQQRRSQELSPGRHEPSALEATGRLSLKVLCLVVLVVFDACVWGLLLVTLVLPGGVWP